MTSVLSTAPLAGLCQLVTDGTHDSPKLQNEGVPFIKGKHISGGFIDFDNCDFITYDDHLIVISRSKPEQGDTLLSNIGSVGDVAYVNTVREFSIKNVALFKPDREKVDPRYMYYLLSSPIVRDGLLSHRSGSAQPFISLGVLRGYEVQYHSALSTQRRIASILSAYDDLIENNARRIAILAEITRRLYEEWFVHLRFPGHEGVKMAEGEIGPVPEGWNVVPAAEVARVIRGRSYKGVELVEEGGLPFVNLKCIDRGGGFRRSGLKRYIGKFKPDQAVQSGDIVMAVTDMTQERRIVARCARVPSLDEKCAVISMDMVKVVPKEGTQQLYLYATFRWSRFSDEVKEHATGRECPTPSSRSDLRFQIRAGPYSCPRYVFRPCASTFKPVRKS